jgi:hypothetical protein
VGERNRAVMVAVDGTTREESDESPAGVGACRDNILTGRCAQLSSRLFKARQDGG